MPTPQSTPAEMLAYWKELSGDDSPTPWQDEAYLGMFFQQFRPYGEGVDAAFEGVAGAEEILPRLREVYRATAEGWQREDSVDAYFIVRKPPPLTAARAVALGTEYLRKVAALAAEFAGQEEHEDAAELAGLLDPLPVMEAAAGERPWPPEDDDAPEGFIYEVIGDYMRTLEYEREPVKSHAFLMDEAFYTLACDPNLKFHLLWPLYRRLTPIEEPFAAYFELWQHGAGYRYEGDGHVKIYVPNLAA